MLLYTATYCTQATIPSTACKKASLSKRGGMFEMTFDAAHDQIWCGQSFGKGVEHAKFKVSRLKKLFAPSLPTTDKNRPAQVHDGTRCSEVLLNTVGRKSASMTRPEVSGPRL